MNLDASIVGTVDETVTVEVDPARLRAFASAIGEQRPVYRDSAAARAAGYPDIPLPPTYHFSLGRERGRPLGMVEDRGVDPLRLLHGEQRFHYKEMAFAGETLTVARRVSDYFEKKEGALRFIVIETEIRKRAGELVSLGHETLVLPDAVPAGLRGRVKSSSTANADSTIFQALRPGPVTRDMLARFGAASGDKNRVHLDRNAARSVGYDDVFAHGMLSMAWLGRLLTNIVDQQHVREFSVRFLAPTPIGADPVCTGEPDPRNGKVALGVLLGDGTPTLTGNALL